MKTYRSPCVPQAPLHDHEYVYVGSWDSRKLQGASRKYHSISPRDIRVVQRPGLDERSNRCCNCEIEVDAAVCSMLMPRVTCGGVVHLLEISHVINPLTAASTWQPAKNAVAPPSFMFTPELTLVLTLEDVSSIPSSPCCVVRCSQHMPPIVPRSHPNKQINYSETPLASPPENTEIHLL